MKRLMGMETHVWEHWLPYVATVSCPLNSLPALSPPKTNGHPGKAWSLAQGVYPHRAGIPSGTIAACYDLKASPQLCCGSSP